jgi:chemotaxis protein MotB
MSFQPSQPTIHGSKRNPSAHGGLGRRFEPPRNDFHAASFWAARRSRWILPYADMLTLMIGFFFVLFAMLQMDQSPKQAPLPTKAIELNAAKPTPLSPPLPAVKPENVIPQIVPKSAPMAPVEFLSVVEDLKTSLQNSHDVELIQEPNQITISIKEPLLFRPGLSSLEPKNLDLLPQIADLLKKNEYDIRIEGHTDNTPIKTAQYPSNWELSTARATTLVRQFVHYYQLSPRRFSVAGYGEFHPRYNNSTIEGKQKNRRVDIVILAPTHLIQSPLEKAHGKTSKT